jgi:GH15 family glucan-1,4-alpha-glucosidase
MQQPAISDYALIGDTRTSALVSNEGSIDWLCVPRFDAPPLFSRLIDQDGGGSFSVLFDGTTDTRRRYLHGSAVVRTDITTSAGRAHVIDGMVANVRDSLLPQNLLIRRLVCDAGEVDAAISFDPRWGLPGRRPDRVRNIRGRGTICEWGSLAVSISCEPEIVIEPETWNRIHLEAGQSLTLVMGVADRAPIAWVSAATADELLVETQRWWQDWTDNIDHEGPFRHAVLRSLITLRLLTYSPSGAPVAAPTTSLPEAIGAGRNWDYRYSWPRDASIGLVAFLSTGNRRLAHSFMHWLLHSSRLTRPHLQVLYDIYGRPAPPEREIEVSGYRDSRPVRVGNDARMQHQLDVYGWVADAAWLLERSGDKLYAEAWRGVAGFADFVAETWRRPDAGIWEVRGEPAQYVHSKLMAWLALDRIARMGRGHRVRANRLQRWELERDAIASWIRTHGVDEKRNTLVRKAGSNEVDAALLVLPVVGFEPEGSPLISGTIDAIREDLEVDEGLVLRYSRRADGLEGDEGAFLPCSFWLVQALAHTGRTDEASEMFERLLSYSNDLGLWAEEIDPTTKEQLGNFPQAFTHATVVQAGLAIRSSRSIESQAG